MKVKLLTEKRVKISPMSTKIYPKDHIGDFDEDMVTKWIEAGEAEAVEVEDVTDPGFSPEQTAALKAAADQILAAQGDNGEPIDLNDLTVPELRGIAEDVELGTAAQIKKMKKPELVEKISAAIAEVQAAAQAAPGDAGGAE